MNKNEFIDSIAHKTGMTKVETGRFIDALIDTIKDTLRNGDDVRLIGFGSFSSVYRQATTGRNPQTGAAISIPESHSPKFKAGKALKIAVNK